MPTQRSLARFRLLRGLCLVAAVALLAGCQSGSLTGQWTSTAINVPEFSDVERTDVTFREDGTTTSTWVHEDGNVETRNARYETMWSTITIYPENDRPSYDLSYEVDGNHLLLQNKKGTIHYKRMN